MYQLRIGRERYRLVGNIVDIALVQAEVEVEYNNSQLVKRYSD